MAIDSPKLVLEPVEESNRFEIEDLVVANNFGRIEDLPVLGFVEFACHLSERVGGFNDLVGNKVGVDVLWLARAKGAGACAGSDTFFDIVAPSL